MSPSESGTVGIMPFAIAGVALLLAGTAMARDYRGITTRLAGHQPYKENWWERRTGLGITRTPEYGRVWGAGLALFGLMLEDIALLEVAGGWLRTVLAGVFWVLFVLVGVGAATASPVARYLISHRRYTPGADGSEHRE